MKEQINKLLAKLPQEKIRMVLLRLQTIPRRLRIIVFSILGLILLLVLIGIIASLFGTRSDPVQESKVVTTRQVTKRPSRYASDSEVLSIEVEIESIKEELDQINFSDPTFNPPILDLEVDFDN